MSTSDVAADDPVATKAPRPWELRAIALLFMVGSFCFAIASVPGIAAVVPASVVGVTYFVGSIFFTSAATFVTVTTWRDQARPGRPIPWDSLDWWAAVIQNVGTFWFNLNTYDAMTAGLSAQQENLRVWTPDFVGSICFLVASELALMSVCKKPVCVCRDDRDWWIAAVNMLGSIFFMISAFAAFTLPDTGDLLDASIANSGTLLGAVCFFWAAWRSWPRAAPVSLAPG